MPTGVVIPDVGKVISAAVVGLSHWVNGQNKQQVEVLMR